jgi:RNA polymerase sigma factor (sigma-70 family)
MSPFKEKLVQWDGDEKGGRYKNLNGFKYDIVAKTMAKKAEDMPACYLAETPKEAQALYDRFEKFLNIKSSAYAKTTGLSKADLFGEGLIGLGRAYRDWDPSRSDDFTVFAKFRIKDALNEFVRGNISTVSVPVYIRKSQANYMEVKSICEAANVDFDYVIKEQELPDELEPNDAIRIHNLILNINRYAERAKISYEEMLNRIVLVPNETEIQEYIEPEDHKREIEKVEATIVVEKLKAHMNENELLICDGIMKGKSYLQIAKEMGMSKGWVSGQLKQLKERIIKMIHDGRL